MDAREIEHQTRMFHRLTDKVKEMAVLKDEEFAVAVDHTFMSYFNDAFDLEKKTSSNEFAHTQITGVAAHHASAYSNNFTYFNKARAEFKEAAMPIKDRVIALVKKREKEEARRLKELESKIADREKELKAIQKELFEHIPEENRYLVTRNYNEYDEKYPSVYNAESALRYVESKITECKIVATMFKLCEEGKTEEVKSAIQEEFNRESASRAAGEKVQTVFSALTLDAVAGSEFSETLYEDVKEKYKDSQYASGRTKWDVESHINWLEEKLGKNQSTMS